MTYRIIPLSEQQMKGETPDIRLLERELRAYPPLKEWVRRVVADQERLEREGITRVSDLLGDRAFVAMSALIGDQSHELWRNPEMRLATAGVVLEAVPVLWPDEMWQTAYGLELPDHVVAPNVLPYPLMYWRFAQARGADLELEWLLVGDSGEGVFVEIFGAPSKRGDIRYSGHVEIPYYAKWPDDFGGDSNVEVVLKMLAFMNSRYVVDSDENLSRPERRSIERTVSDPLLRGCTGGHVIRLRSPEPVASEHGDSGNGRYSHRWFVRGHYRAQWLPSKKAHRVQWIAAYVKGPADKPIELPAVKIAR